MFEKKVTLTLFTVLLCLFVQAEKIVQGVKDIEAIEVAHCLELLQSGKAKEAYPALLKLHEAGNSRATGLIGLMYLKGDGVAEDPVIASFYLERASKMGDSQASFILAYRQQDDAGYAKMMLKSAEQGHLIAAQQIGLCYYNGRGVEIDNVQAYRWLFSIQLRTPVAVETFTVPMAELEQELSAEEREIGRVGAWNLVYIDTQSGFSQKEFEANNPGLKGAITVDNYEVKNGHLIIRSEN
jgi:hypothetical protein